LSVVAAGRRTRLERGNSTAALNEQGVAKQLSVEAVIEQLCTLGCKTVYQVIAQLRDGQIPASMADLGEAQCAEVLVELQSIMAVYTENGSVCSNPD